MAQTFEAVCDHDDVGRGKTCNVLQFFGQMTIDGASEVIVTLKDVAVSGGRVARVEDGRVARGLRALITNKM